MIRVSLLVAVVLIQVQTLSARDIGQWSDGDQELRQWYAALMQPDVPETSCCGEADAYWADDVRVRDGRVYASITDDRDDAPRGRLHVENGTEFEIPPNKLKWSNSDPQRTVKIARNPTGHGVIFISRDGYVFCYVLPGGV